MLPKLESHRGFGTDVSSGAEVGHQVELEEEQEEEVERERHEEEDNSRRKTQVRMHG